MTAKSTNNNQGLRRAVFAGSFNPFTVGHASIVERGLGLFDEIIIAVGINRAKTSHDSQACVEAIDALYNNEPRVRVLKWDGLMADLAAKEGCRFFLRGVRNTTDFEYEKSMAEINRRLSGIETVFLPSLPEHEAVSSSVVRELQTYGADIDGMVP